MAGCVLNLPLLERISAGVHVRQPLPYARILAYTYIIEHICACMSIYVVSVNSMYTNIWACLVLMLGGVLSSGI